MRAIPEENLLEAAEDWGRESPISGRPQTCNKRCNGKMAPKSKAPNSEVTLLSPLNSILQPSQQRMGDNKQLTLE
ncbi:hypothetical protein AMECASPLE_007825 [Ameca splendens]|uniref:Uncharacterized protein n=1 Tax=Ameca splendens TaxID=208324 RepID=A0ABV0YN55_9TELE